MIDEEHDRRITSFTNSKKKREGERKKEITIIGSGKFTYGVVSSAVEYLENKF